MPRNSVIMLRSIAHNAMNVVAAIPRMVLSFVAVLLAAPAFADGWIAGREAAPTVLSGDMAEDFRRHALTAQVCAVDELPTPNILQSWKKLGVRMLRRAEWSREESPEFFRRKAGFLAFHAGADGVWLPNAEAASGECAAALKAVEDDITVVRRLADLADRAATNADHRVRFAGRRAKGLLLTTPFESADLDALRLEFAAYVRYLELLLGLPEAPLPTMPAEPLATAPTALTPFEKGAFSPVEIDYAGVSVDKKLAEGFSFHADNVGFTFFLRGKEPVQGYPGGVYRLKLYLPGEKNAFDSPYEYVIDLSPIAPHRAPAPAAGHVYWIRERFGKGGHAVYGDPDNWRCRQIQHRSWGPGHRKLTPFFIYVPKDGSAGWKVTLQFSWLPLYGRWPATGQPKPDRWCVTLDRLPDGSPGGACVLRWPKGDASLLRSFAERASNYGAIHTWFDNARASALERYGRWHSEGLYEVPPMTKPTFQIFSAEDEVFQTRCLQPLIDERLALDALMQLQGTQAKVLRKDSATQMRAWKSLDRLLDFDAAVWKARRDYLVGRFAGKLPPERTKKQSAKDETDALSPDASDEPAIDLDDKDF